MKTCIKKEWTIERIQLLPDAQISVLRKNAIERQRLDVSSLCEAVLQRKSKNKMPRKSIGKKAARKNLRFH
jgi:hypothetical protein